MVSNINLQALADLDPEMAAMLRVRQRIAADPTGAALQEIKDYTGTKSNLREGLTTEEFVQKFGIPRVRRGTQSGDFSSTMIPQGARQHSGLIVPSDMYNVMNREPLTSRQPALGASNLPIASMQAQRNMTPGGMAAYQSAAQFAGIPEDEFKYSLQTTNPGGFQSTMKKKTQKRPTYA